MEKDFSELTFTDSFMFAHIMVHHPDICKEVIRRVVGDNIGKFEYARSEDSIKITNDARGIRLDILVKGEDGTMYNIEMQNAQLNDEKKRLRYYQGAIDQELLKPGDPFSKLPESIVAMICNFDPFGRGLAKYTFEERCLQNFDLALGDGTKKVFVCIPNIAKGLEADDLARFLAYCQDGNPTDDFTTMLDDAVEMGRKNAEWRNEYMTLEMMKNQWFSQGEAKGRAEERAENEKRTFLEKVELLLGFDLSDEEMAKRLNSSVEDVRKAVEKIRP